MSDADFRKIAEELIELEASGRVAEAFSARFPKFDAELAYRVARRLHEHRLAIGWRQVGRKIGFTNRTIWPRYGVYEPIWGYVYDRTLIHAEGERAEVPLDGLAQPRIEPEIVFKLQAPAPRLRDPQALIAAIEWVAHGCEIVQCHHPDWKVKLPDTIAANGLHGRLVVGTPVPARKIPDLATRLPALQVALRRGERLADRGVGANVLDSPLLALEHLVELLADDEEYPQLQAGEIVTTGTLTDAHPVAPGETWSTELTGLPLPGLTLRFT
jgi:2-oxo-3-hexenedioate decarboxylase